MRRGVKFQATIAVNPEKLVERVLAITEAFYERGVPSDETTVAALALIAEKLHNKLEEARATGKCTECGVGEIDPDAGRFACEACCAKAKEFVEGFGEGEVTH